MGHRARFRLQWRKGGAEGARCHPLCFAQQAVGVEGVDDHCHLEKMPDPWWRLQVGKIRTRRCASRSEPLPLAAKCRQRRSPCHPCWVKGIQNPKGWRLTGLASHLDSAASGSCFPTVSRGWTCHLACSGRRRNARDRPFAATPANILRNLVPSAQLHNGRATTSGSYWEKRRVLVSGENRKAKGPLKSFAVVRTLCGDDRLGRPNRYRVSRHRLHSLRHAEGRTCSEPVLPARTVQHGAANAATGCT